MNDELRLWQSLSHVSEVLVTWKGIGLLVRKRFIVDLLFLVKHVLLLTNFVRLKLSQNSSNFLKPIQSVLLRSMLKSPITIRLSYLLTALLRELVNSSKNISRLVEVVGLQTLRQNRFFFDMVNSEAIVSLTFVSYSLIFW